MHKKLDRRQFVAGAAVSVTFAAGLAPVWAAAVDPAARRIESYYASLLPVVKAAQGLGVAERARRISPAVLSAFDVGTMTRLAVGPAWSGFSGSQRSEAT